MNNEKEIENIRSFESPISKKELFEFLKGFPMLTGEEVQIIVDNSNIRFFKKGACLLREGQIASKCYLVLKGCVREYYLIDGEEKSTAFFTEGHSVNSFTSSTNNAPSKHFLVCAEDCILTVSDENLETEMCRLIPRLESIIRQEVEKETGKAKDEFARFVTSSPEERYMDLLKVRPDLLKRIPQHQIASFIGVTPESLSRIRKRMFRKMKNNEK
jgi:CRP-like cAMP-binding protein